MADEDDEKVLLGQGPGLAHQCHDGIPTGAEARRGQLLSYREIGQGSGARFMRRRVGLGTRSVAREGRDSRRRSVINAEPTLDSCRDEKRKAQLRRGEKEVSQCTLVQERDPRVPVRKEKVDRREKENRNTRVGIGNALRTDIAPSNVAHVGPGGQGGSSASARQAATAIRFAHMGHVNDAPDWRLPPPEGTEGAEGRGAQSSAFLGPTSCSAGRKQQR